MKSYEDYKSFMNDACDVQISVMYKSYSSVRNRILHIWRKETGGCEVDNVYTLGMHVHHSDLDIC